MLPRGNRLLSADDFRVTLRKGRRRSGRYLVVSVLQPREDEPTARPRFGFIVTRKVGNAVQRNRLRRQLRAAASELLDQPLTPSQIVVRVIPGSVGAPWTELRQELQSLVIGEDSR